MVDETRLLLQDRFGFARKLLKVDTVSDGGAVVAPLAIAPALLQDWEPPLVAKVPDVDGLHLTVHADGVAHIRENGTDRDLVGFRVPPLRDFAASSYFLQIFPGPVESYPIVRRPRHTDMVVDVAGIQGQGFSVNVGFGITDEATTREALPGIHPIGPPRGAYIARASLDNIHVTMALTWQLKGGPPPPKREVWAPVRFPDESGYLPRPIGGTTSPHPWGSRVNPSAV